MLETHRDLVSYLISKGHLTPKDIVTGDLRVVDVSSRSRNAMVSRRIGTEYMVKQGYDFDHVGQSREAQVYRHLAKRRDSHVSRYLPKMYAYEDDAHILILEKIPDAQTLTAYHTTASNAPILIGKAVGRALGSIHKDLNSGAQGEGLEPAEIGPVKPWVLSVHRPDVAVLAALSNANVQLLHRLQESSALCSCLQTLNDAWRYECLIHQDLKWDNCVVQSRPSTRTDAGLRFVDWELAGIGDPAWDVGTMVANYLAFWLLALPLSKHQSIDDVLESTPRPLASFQPAMRSFLSAYQASALISPSDYQPFLRRVVGYTAARLIQIAFEYLQSLVEMPAQALYFLQVGLNFAEHPQEALVHLVGLEPSAARGVALPYRGRR